MMDQGNNQYNGLQQYNSQPQPEMTQPVKRKSRLPMIIIVAVLAAAFFAAGFFGAKLLFGKNSSENPKDSSTVREDDNEAVKDTVLPDKSDVSGKTENAAGSENQTDPFKNPDTEQTAGIDTEEYPEEEYVPRPFPESMPEPADMKGADDFELCGLIFDGTRYLTKDWLDENEFLDFERCGEAADIIYEWSEMLAKEGVIEGSSLCRESDSVAFFLFSGIDYVYVPSVEGKFSGSDNYTVVSVNVLPGWQDVLISAFNPIDTSGSEESADYIEENMAEYANHKNMPGDEAKVYSVRELFRTSEYYKNRVIFWRGHGGIYDNRNGEKTILLALTEKATDFKKELYNDELYPADGSLPTVCVCRDNSLAILPEFVKKYMSKCDGGLFFCGSCYSGQDEGRFARILFEKGFDAYVGAHESIDTWYSDELMGAVAENLCKKDEQDEYYKIKDALSMAKNEKGSVDSTGAWFRLYQNYATNPFRLLPYELKTATGNAGKYVSYNGKTFFRRYSLKNVSKEGLVGFFTTNYTESSVFCNIDKDGETKELETFASSPELAVFRENYVFQEVNTAYPECSYVFLMDRKFKRRVNCANGTMVTTEPKHGLVAVKSYSGFTIIDAVRENVYSLNAENPYFILNYKGWMYYSTETENGDVVLHAYDMVNDINKDYGIISYYYSDGIGGIPMNVVRSQPTRDGIVFLCGAYAGSGIILQKATFAYLDFETDEVQSELPGLDHERYNVTDDFYISGNILYAATVDASTYDRAFIEYNMETGEITVSDYHTPYSLGKSFCEDGSYSMYVDDDNVKYTFLPASELAVIANEMGAEADNNKYVLSVSDACCVGSYIYYTITAGKKDSSLDIGWREGCRLLGRRVYRYNIKKGTSSLLYEY